jgi:hypothetical protein
MQTEISCKTSSLLKTLKGIKAVIKDRNKRSGAKAIEITLEITITDGMVTFVIPGCNLPMKCKTIGTVKATLPFLRLYNAVLIETNPEMHIVVTKGNLQVNLVRFFAQTCFFEDDNILRSVNLSINYSDAELLRLGKQGFTEQELYFNRLGHKIDRANENLNKNVLYAHKVLCEYGVDIEDIEKLVMKSLFD